MTKARMGTTLNSILKDFNIKCYIEIPIIQKYFLIKNANICLPTLLALVEASSSIQIVRCPLKPCTPRNKWAYVDIAQIT